ncbi:MAG: ATP-binding protein [Atopobiaceae bacterium]|nr:ATP-binding protein [Atopobiaceae bacterium]
MAESIIRLSVPAEPSYARSVRMMAANLAVLCSMSVDEVEDARMAAEEAFVYACATQPESCDMTFSVTTESLDMSFSLGGVVPAEDEALSEQISLAELLLSAVSDSYEVADDRSELRVTKLVGVVHDA